MPSARQHIEIDAAADRVMAVLTDFPAYPQFLPEIERIEVLESGLDRWDVRFHANVFRPFQYTLRLERGSPLRLSWAMLSGLFTSNDGSWDLEQVVGEGAVRTRATYSIDLVLGLFVPQTLVNSLVGVTLPATLARFKARIEGA
ncbi:MAG: SRPBCC family protein [Pseudomonadota bacterium]